MVPEPAADRASASQFVGGNLTFVPFVTTAPCTTPSSYCGTVTQSSPSPCIGADTGCTSNSDCGDVSREGICHEGACQCGFGFRGVRGVATDPPLCEPVCAAPVPDLIVSLNEPLVNTWASGGLLFHNVSVSPFWNQRPITFALVMRLASFVRGVLLLLTPYAPPADQPRHTPALRRPA